jgi:hypothetical protein
MGAYLVFATVSIIAIGLVVYYAIQDRKEKRLRDKHSVSVSE